MGDHAAAIVTGGGSGIGLACATSLARAGCEVLIAGRRVGVLEEAANGIRDAVPSAKVHTLSCDLGERDAPRELVDKAIATMGSVDVLVNAAASCTPCDPMQMTSEVWDSMLNVALRGAAICSLEAAKHMVGRGGRIIMITSVVEQQAEPGLAHYCAAKAGLAAVARSLATDLAKHEILVNCVAPGWVQTPTAGERLSRATPESRARVNPLARWGRPEEVGNVVAYLALEAPTYLTGATIVIDGGQTVMAAMP